jgi:hypothetical protein
MKVKKSLAPEPLVRVGAVPPDHKTVEGHVIEKFEDPCTVWMMKSCATPAG